MTKETPERIQLWFDAAKKGDADAMRAMIDEGFDPDAPDSNLGSSALVYAANTGSGRIAELLLDAGADPIRPNVAGFRPWDYAIKEGHLDVLRLLITPSNAETRSAGGLTPLIWCAYRNQLACLRHVISLGADLGAVDGQGRGAPMWCVLRESLECLRELALSGASLGASSNGLNDPLAIAARDGQADFIDFIKAWRERSAIEAIAAKQCCLPSAPAPRI